MRLFILGATGDTGRQLVNQALERGDEVTALVRAPEKLDAVRKGLKVLRGDPRSVTDLADALTGYDAVLSALGPPGIGTTTILRDCARSTAAAMQSAGVRRLLVVSVAALFPDAGIVAALLRRTLLKNIAQDSLEMERIILATDLDWTIARPPRLTNGPLTKRYLAENGRLPHGRRSISRADLACFLLDEVRQRAHLREVVGVA